MVAKQQSPTAAASCLFGVRMSHLEDSSGFILLRRFIWQADVASVFKGNGTGNSCKAFLSAAFFFLGGGVFFSVCYTISLRSKFDS
jgi:hypothetical protein